MKAIYEKEGITNKPKQKQTQKKKLKKKTAKDFIFSLRQKNYN